MSSSKLASLLVLITLIWTSATFSAQAAALPNYSQSIEPADATLIGQLRQASGGDAQIARHSATGKVRFLRAGSQQPLWQPSSLAATTPEQSSRAFLSAYGSLFGLRGQGR